MRQAALWALPALVFGAGLRLLFLIYLPYGYWGSDSYSYYAFTERLLTTGDISLAEKRRYLYPLLMLPMSLLPGAPMRWLPWLQHGVGLATLIPLAYVVRKSLVHWKLWVVPVTVCYTSMPILLWYEHELLGESLYYACVVWAFAGWVAWVKEERLARARVLFWWLFVPLAFFLLTKPSGRFVWPGLLVGLVLVAAWRRLSRWQVAAIIALMLATLTVGAKKQGMWLLYSAVFPLTRLDSPLHAEYKAEIRDFVTPLRRDLDVYYLNDGEPKSFLERPGREPVARPHWVPLQKDQRRRAQLYKDLALEAIRAEPGLFLYLGLERLIGSCNLSEFKYLRFQSQSYLERCQDDYEAALPVAQHPVRIAFGLPRTGDLPPLPDMRQRLAPHPDSWMERTLVQWAGAYQKCADLFKIPRMKNRAERSFRRGAPTPLGWWLLAAMPLALLPRYRPTLGVWMLVALSYLAGVFLVTSANVRFFAPAWGVFVPLLAVPADVLARLLVRAFALSKGAAGARDTDTASA